MSYVDSHAHLDFPEILLDLDQVLGSALDADVSTILSVACVRREEQTLDGVLAIADQHPQVCAAAGVHPHDASVFDERVEARIVSAMSHPKVVAWGEIGLDFHYDNSPRRVQADVFRRQLRAARDLGKPVIIHSRSAAEETCGILEEEFADSGLGGVMHCFSYDQKVADRCLEFGFHLSFGGILTFPKAEELRQIAKATPSDRYLIETDSPYLAPVPFRGKSNRPAWVARVAEKLAEVRGVPEAVVGSQSTANFKRLFGFPN